jgi:hypothetical protein
MRFNSSSTLNLKSAGSNRPPRKTTIRHHAGRMIAIAAKIGVAYLAMGTSTVAMLYDELGDPLGRAAVLLGDLRQLEAEGYHLADGDRTGPPTAPALALELREAADRLAGEHQQLAEAVALHQSIQARRSCDPLACFPSPMRTSLFSR